MIKIESQKEYLKRYLSSDTKDGKKKKKQKLKPSNSVNIQRLQIVDDDIDPLNMKSIAEGDLDLYELTENAPQIAGIIDERPPELQALETFQNATKWRVIAADDEDIKVQMVDGNGVPIPSGVSQSTLVGSQSSRHQSVDASAEIISRISISSQKRKVDFALSPPKLDKDAKRYRKNSGSLPPGSRGNKDSDSDLSPPRSTKDLEKKRKRDSDSDLSPPRSGKDLKKKKKRRDSDGSLPRSSKDLNRRGRKDSYSDLSPERSSKDSKKKKKKKRKDSDVSPPRSSKDLHHRGRKDSYSDLSPERSSKDSKKKKKKRDFDVSPPRSSKDLKKKKRRDSDVSPPRSSKDLKKKKRRDSDVSPPRSSKDLKKKKRRDSDVSPPRSSKDLNRRGRKDSDSDLSPPRSSKDLKKQKKRRDSDVSPPRSSKDMYRRGRKDSYSEMSPPRSSKDSKKKRDSDMLPPGSSKDLYRRGRKDSDSDLSPPRSSKDLYHKGRKDSDSDLSPPRSRKDLHERMRRSPDLLPPRSGKNSHKTKSSYDSDLATPRAMMSKLDIGSHSTDEMESSNKPYEINPDHYYEVVSAIVKGGRGMHSNKSRGSQSKDDYRKDDRLVDLNYSPDRMKEKPGTSKHTLDGKAAGLQDAKTLKEETKRIKAKEQAHFAQMSDEVSGRGASTIVRDRKTGRKRDLDKEARDQMDKEAAEDERLAEFKKIGKGLVQVQEQATRVREHLHEMNKPLARYADDQDLENLLKAVEREGDPMLEYLRQKKEQENPSAVRARYAGPAPPPNRFNIMPGHMWDGVDRSTGFEKKLFESQNAAKAGEEEAYKWSVSDM